MMVSARGAADLLGIVGLSREQARWLLLAGMAGRGTRAGRALLYDEQRVLELSRRPLVDHDLVDELCPTGMFLGRVSRVRPIDLAADWAGRREAVCRSWSLHRLDRILVASRVERDGSMPFVATHSGFVVFGADIRGVQVSGTGTVDLDLTEPAGWFAHFEGRRLLAGAGRTSLIWGWPWPQDRPQDRPRHRPRDRLHDGPGG